MNKMDAHFIDTNDLEHDPGTLGALDENEKLKILPYSFWQQFKQAEIGVFCVRQGLYCIPTTELIDWLRGRIGDRKAIEIGAGNGVMADALDIPATDNRMQEWPQIRAAYLAAHQPTVPYGANVQQLDAQVAITRHKPQIVVAAWVTHKYDKKEHWREGNQHGVEETKVIKQANYIHIGNRHVHRHKPALELPHEEFEFPWLVSRAMNGSPNFIATWSKA